MLDVVVVGDDGESKIVVGFGGEADGNREAR